MFGWFRRLFGIFTSKADSLLDKIEDPKAALDQVIKDMQTNIQSAKNALGSSEVDLRRARISQRNFEVEAINFRKSAERYIDEGNETYARQMLRRAVESEKASHGFRDVADKLEVDIEMLRESIRRKEIKYQEAKSTKHSILAQKRVSENLSRLNKGGSSSEGNAFTEYERLTEKIVDQSVEAQTAFTMSSDVGTSGDGILLEASVENELEQLKQKLGKTDKLQLEVVKERDVDSELELLKKKLEKVDEIRN